MLGVALAGPVAIIGGLVHLIHQGLMKITLFFCAGALAETLHIHRIDEMDGVGRRMPMTMVGLHRRRAGDDRHAAHRRASSASGISAPARLRRGSGWVVGVLAGSSLLNAAYFLPVLYRAWFLPADGPSPRLLEREGAWGLVLPPLATAVAALGAGLFAAQALSPLGWAWLIAARDYGL